MTALRTRARRAQSVAQEDVELTRGQAWGVLSPDVLALSLLALDLMLVPLAPLDPAAQYGVIVLVVILSVLLLLIARSYVRLVEGYPEGGGAYTLAKEYLGVRASLPLASLLMFNTVLFAAVAVSLAVSLVTHVFPHLSDYREALSLAALAIITLLHLRGTETIRPMAIFSYLFLGALGVIILLSISRFFDHSLVPTIPSPVAVTSAIEQSRWSPWIRSLVLGCLALAGFEALSNSICIFQRRLIETGTMAFRRLAWTVVAFLIFTTVLILSAGVDFAADRHFLTILGELAFGGSFGWIIWVPATVLLLLAATNRSYARFPVVASVIAQDRYLPRQLASLGDRLVFANSMVAITAFAVALVLSLDVDPLRLGSVLAVSTLASLALTEAAMARASSEFRKQTRPAIEFQPVWLHALLSVICAVGAALGLVHFWTRGAWIVILVVPLAVWYFIRVKDHYLRVGGELSLPRDEAPPQLQRLHHTVIVPVSGLHRGVIDALRYGVSISEDVRACYVELDPEQTERLQEQWNRWAHEVPFVVLRSKNRSVVSPLLEYIQDLEQTTHNELITVIIPEFVTTRWWHRLLHNQTAFLIRTALVFKPGIVVTSVRYHLKES